MGSARRLHLVCTAALAALAVASTARGDEVVLDNGRTLVGRVVSDDGTTIKLEMETGTMKIDRAHVREVKKAPLPAKRADPSPGGAGTAAPKPGVPAPAGAPSGAQSGRDAAAPAAKPTQAVERPYPRTLAEQIAELEQTQLTAWPDLETRGTGADPKNPWKVTLPSGQTEYRSEAPSPSECVSQVWKLRLQGGGAYVFYADGVAQCEWAPMFWDADRSAWWIVSPAQQAFQRYDAISKSALGKVCCRDLNAWVTCNILVRTMGEKQGGSRVRNTSVSIAEETSKLRAAAAKATGSDAMGADAARCLEIEHEMAWESPAGKVRFARERTAILRRLVAAMPAEPSTPPKR